MIVSEIEKCAYVRMNRPDVRNAFNPEMIQQIENIFNSFEKRKDLRAVVFSGEGKVFSAGADLNWMSTMVRYSYEQNRDDAKGLYSMFNAIWRCPIPVVGQVRGAAMGGALGLMACCDYVCVEEGTQLAFTEVKLGIAPAIISSFVLRKVNPGRIRYFMLSGKSFTAEQAVDFGLAHQVHKGGEGDRVVQEIIASFADAGPQATREIKSLLNDAYHLGWQEMEERTIKLIAQMRVSSEGQEGLKSFLEKRSPSWKDIS